jgi:hypothetical protein
MRLHRSYLVRLRRWLFSCRVSSGDVSQCGVCVRGRRVPGRATVAGNPIHYFEERLHSARQVLTGSFESDVHLGPCQALFVLSLSGHIPMVRYPVSLGYHQFAPFILDRDDLSCRSRLDIFRVPFLSLDFQHLANRAGTLFQELVLSQEPYPVPWRIHCLSVIL